MRSRRRLKAAVAVAAAVVATTTSPADADGTADAWTDGGSVAAEATNKATTQSSTGGLSASRPVCTFHRLSAERAALAEKLAGKDWGNAKGEGPGSWFRKICETGEGSSWADVVWVRDRPDPEVLAEQAAERVGIPTPGIRMNPGPGQVQVVHVPTWLWLEPETWAPVSATAAAGGVSVTATAAPERVVWDMGNGDKVTCNGPGSAYDPKKPASQQRSTCTYTYDESSTKQRRAVFTVTATTVWRLSWTASGAPGGGGLGTATRSASVAVRVAEIQSLNQ